MDEGYVNVCSPPAPGEQRPGGPVQPPRAANACSGLCSGPWSSGASLDRFFPLCLGLLLLVLLTRLLVTGVSCESGFNGFHLKNLLVYFFIFHNWDKNPQRRVLCVTATSQQGAPRCFVVLEQIII